MEPVRCSWGGVSRWLYVSLPPSGLGWSLDVLLLACEQSFFTTGLVTAPFQPGVLVLAARSSGVVFLVLFPFGVLTRHPVPCLPWSV